MLLCVLGCSDFVLTGFPRFGVTPGSRPAMCPCTRPLTPLTARS